jgi:hypothetical protein
MTRTYHDALKRAIELTRAKPERREQIDWKLQHDGWEERAVRRLPSAMPGLEITAVASPTVLDPGPRRPARRPAARPE